MMRVSILLGFFLVFAIITASRDRSVVEKANFPHPAEPALEVRVVFGYKDSRPARFVSDRYERLLLIDRLLSKCGATERVCNFRRDPHDSELFTRHSEGKTKAGEMNKPSREIRVRVVQSSVGADDEENRADPFQAWRSAYARRMFLDGLNDSQVVIYNGHSRAGGGPDFAPPHLAADSDVNYIWYRANRPGIRPVIARLRRSSAGRSNAESSDLRLLGFLSCASTKLFVRAVTRARPGLATVTSTKLLYFSDAYAALVDTLEAVFGEKRGTTRVGEARVVGEFYGRNDR